MAQDSIRQDSKDPEDLYVTAAGFECGEVFHGFFCRNGGVSAGIYESLNCGPGSDDNPAHVKQNREIVAQAAGVSPDNMITLYQVHGNTCLSITGPLDERPEADACVTDVPGLALGILTADCAPVLFSGRGPNGPVIGAAHAGWKGALGGVLEATLEAMQKLGAQDIRAAIGPCIGKRSYEVSQDFMQTLLDDNVENERFFSSARKSGHFMFDLAGYCAFRLYSAGVRDVHLTDMDTYALEDRFFSYRRKTHRNEPDYGRQVSLIVIK